LAAQRRRTWDEHELKRIADAQRAGISMRAIAQRFDCHADTIRKKLAEMRAREERLIAAYL
jgi:lambda repressor-like predicted transcriptional regulator